jgi:hypothetical protein
MDLLGDADRYSTPRMEHLGRMPLAEFTEVLRLLAPWVKLAAFRKHP